MPARLHRFGDFELDRQSYELRRDGRPLKIERIPFELLAFLVERPGVLVDRATIEQQLWGNDVFVEAEHSINTAINKVRRALRDDPAKPRFIQTVFGKGYRFVGLVEVIEPPQVVEPVAVSPPPTLVERPESPPENKLQPDGRPPRWRQKTMLATAAVAAVLFLWWIGSQIRSRFTTESPSGTGVIQSIAVLPLANLSANPDQEYLVDGMTDGLITDLARTTSLRVISRTSVMRFKDSHAYALPEIAKMLNVDAVVEGTVLKSGDHVQISVQLLDARRDKHLWAQVYDRKNADLFEMQKEVVSAVSAQVSAAISPNKTGVQEKSNKVTDAAYDNYLRGRYFWEQYTPEATTKAVQYTSRAIEQSPDYALAYVARAEAHLLEYTFSLRSPSDAFRLARGDAAEALRLDASLGSAHTILGVIADDMWDWDTASRELQIGVSLEPGNEAVHRHYSRHLMAMDRRAEAAAEAQRALEIDPLGQITALQVGLCAMADLRYADAVGIYHRMLDLYPDSPAIRLYLALAYVHLNRMPEAVAEVEQFERSGEPHPEWLAFTGFVYGRAGRKQRAQTILDAMLKMPAGARIHPVDIAYIYLGMGDHSNALEWLERAYDEHDPGLKHLKVDDDYLPLHQNPRYEALLRRMNFPQ